MKTYLDYIQQIEDTTQLARQLPLGTAPMPEHPALAPDAPKVLIFSPHPDDEAIIGALPLRLLKENGYRIINVAVTLGSLQERQAGRAEELRNACRYLGFDLQFASPHGLADINLATREKYTAQWQRSIDCIAAILHKHQPAVIFIPHEADWNSTHIGTHFLVTDALQQLKDITCHVIETEFWQAMETPGIMVESSQEDTAQLTTALSFHIEEVKRNPYHLNLPAWMQDNVRRGSEHLAGQGGQAPRFSFATLYRYRIWKQGQLTTCTHINPFWGINDTISTLFN